MVSPDEAAEHARRCIWPRYKGDEWPEAMVERARTKAALQNAWQAVADAAQSNASSVGIGHGVRYSKAHLERLIDKARALEQPAQDAALRARILEDRDERTQRRLEAALT
jgi:hypothetical protein